MQDPQNAGFGAKCAVHPDRVASRTCTRCGNFTCDECNANGTEALCPTCRAHVGGDAFPVTRATMTFDQVWGFAFERWKKEWVMLSVCVLILFAVGFVVSLFNGVFQGIAKAIIGNRGGQSALLIITFAGSLMAQVISVFVQGVFQMGLFRIYIDVLNGKKADVNRLLSQVPKLGRYVLQTLLIGVVAVVPLLLYFGLLGIVGAAISGVSLTHLDHLDRDVWPKLGLIFAIGALPLIPLSIYFGLPLQFATMELVYGDTEPVESVRRAFKIADGYRVSIFGFNFVAGLIAVAGVFACCVGILPAVALAQMVMTGLYLGLRNGSGLPTPPEA